MALRGHEATHGFFPAGTLAGEMLCPEQRLSWVPSVLSWTDFFQSMRYLFDKDRPWDSPENRLPRIEIAPIGEPAEIRSAQEPPEFPRGLSCPANHCRAGTGLPGLIDYVGIAGLGTDAPSLPTGHPCRGIRLRSTDADG